MLKPFDKKTITYTFRDGQKVELKEPTLLQLQSAKNKNKDEIAVTKSLLIDMSEGEMNQEFLDSLPLSEFMELSKFITSFIGLDEKD